MRNGPVEDINIYVVYDKSGEGPCQVKFDANPALYGVDELERLQRRYVQLLSALDDPMISLEAWRSCLRTSEKFCSSNGIGPTQRIRRRAASTS